MQIVTYEYYHNVWLGEPIAGTEFARAEAKAERAVSQITFGRSANFDDLPPYQREAVVSAICCQIEYYALMGTDVSINGDTGGAGWTVGKVHVNGGTGAADGRTGGKSMLCASAVAALEQSGLMNPQAALVGDLYAPQPWEV